MMMLVKCGLINPFGNTLGVKNGHVAMVIGVIDGHRGNRWSW